MRTLIPNSMLRSLSNQNITVTETFINGENIGVTTNILNDFFPINTTTYVSRLLPSHVLSASCVKSDDNWAVTIRLRDEPLDAILNAMQRNAGNVENMSETELENFMTEIFNMSGYISSMDLGFDQERDGSGRRQQSGGSHPNADRMEGGFQNGTITAIINQEGKITSLTHTYYMSINFSLLWMNGRINIASKKEYQLIYHTPGNTLSYRD
jgi:hypothetical protein